MNETQLENSQIIFNAGRELELWKRKQERDIEISIEGAKRLNDLSSVKLI